LEYLCEDMTISDLKEIKEEAWPDIASNQIT
jgi:hypothetical protein